jgi:WD40 repeat protein
MANSLIASDKGLQLVDEAREKQGWHRTDKRFLEAAGNISRATLNRFYAKKPVKHDNFVAICKAVGIKTWHKVAETVLSTEKIQVVAQIPPTTLEELDRGLRAWFGALHYAIEDIEKSDLVQIDEYFEWIVRIPSRRTRVDRVLIHGITGEAGIQDLARVETVVRERKLDEGYLVTDYRVSRSVSAYLAEEEKKGNNRILCLTVDELIDQYVDFSPYIEWLEGEIQQLEIDKDYIQLDCSKPEKDPLTGKYKTPIAKAMGAERIDEYMDEWLDSAQKNHISVLGEFGTGKTWFAKHYAWVGVRAYLHAKDKHVKRPRLPLLITLRDYANAVNLKVGTVIAGFFFNEHDISLNSEVFDRLNQMGKLLILFDGFDEMTQQIDKQKIIDNFWALAGDEVITQNSKVILTCRIEHFPTTDDNKKVFEGGERASTQAKVAAAPKFEILNLHPLSIEQIRQVLTNRGATPETINKILANPELADLVKRPMMVDLVLEALPEISEGKEIDLARVYLYALKHKLARDIETKRTFNSMADKLFFLCEVSWAMLSQNRFTLHYSQFPERLKELFGDAIKDNKLDHWHHDMMCQTILIRDHDGNYRPAHKSLLEFFVAFKFAAELGLLHDDFLGLVREPGERDLPIAERGYQWTDYWRYCRETHGQRGEIARFKQVEISKLVATFGASPLIPAVMNLLLPMLDLEVSYHKMNPLLELMQWTQGKTEQEVNYLGSNAGSALVKLNPYGLEYQDLSQAVLPDIDLVGAGLREVNLVDADLANAATTKTFSTCNAIAISADERYFFTGHSDGTVRIWTIGGQELLICRDHQSPVYSIAVSGDWLFSGSGDNTVRQWEIATGRCFQIFSGHQDSVRSIVLSGEWLFSGSDDKTVKQWEIVTGQCLQTFSGHQDSVKSIVLSGEWLFSGSDDKTVKQWEIVTGQCIFTLTDHESSSVNSLAVSKEWLFAGNDDRTVKQWEIATGKCLRTFSGHRKSVNALAINGKWLFSGSNDRTVKQWEIATGKCLRTFSGHRKSVNALAISGKWLFSGSNDKTVKQWEIATGQCIHTFSEYQSLIRSIAVNQGYFFSCGDDKTVKQWAINTGKCIHTFLGHKTSVRAVAVSGKYLFSGSLDGTLKQWDIVTGKCIQTFSGHQGAVKAVAVSGQYLFSSSLDGTLKQWDIVTGKYIQTFSGHKTSVQALSVSGKLLFSGSFDKTVKQWDIATGQCIHTFLGHQGAVRSIAISGEYFFSGSDDKTVKQWDIATGQCIHTFLGHENLVISVAISGECLFSGSDDKTIKQWNIVTGQYIHTFLGHQGAARSLAVSEELLFSGSSDGTVKQWDIATGKCVATFDNSLCAGANITGVRGLTEAQISSLQTLGAISDDLGIN